jgi:toxin ParE1/3/4
VAKVDWTGPALKDLEIIVRYIAMDSPRYAEGFSKRLVRAPLVLKEYPLIGRVVPEYELSNFRELIHGAYRIIYEIRHDTCYIEAVIHASRDLMMHYEPGKWDVTE